MSDQPPSYQAAVKPSVNITSPQGDTHRANSATNLQDANSGHSLGRVMSNASTMSNLSTDDLPGVDPEVRRSMDDESRELPKGWVRCFDPKTEHHFYVDQATKRSIWIHPYDDPEYINSLPDTHPANPNSAQAQAIRKRAEDEELQKKRMKESKEQQRKAPVDPKGGEDRNWFQQQKDKLVGTKEERQARKDEKKRVKEEERKKIIAAQQEYVRRRQELIQKQLNDPNIQRMYASDPYGYSAPSTAFSRGGGMYGSPYGYGYSGGYGRRGYGGYGGGMGLPLVGGLGGGLLLGSMLGGGLGGGYGYGGGFGGGCGGGGGGCGGGGGGCGGGGGM